MGEQHPYIGTSPPYSASETATVSKAPHDEQQPGGIPIITSSHWTVPEQQTFASLLHDVGTNWTAIAKLMGTKTEDMVGDVC